MKLCRHAYFVRTTQLITHPGHANNNTNVQGTEWKRMRALMSGVFTSGRLKANQPYVYLISDVDPDSFGSVDPDPEV